MFSLVDRFFNKKTNSKDGQVWKESFLKEFYSQPEHRWIISHPQIQSAFDDVWTRLPLNLFEYLHRQSILFLRSEEYQQLQKKHSQFKNTIVVFPEYEKLLASQKLHRIAYIAHELAFVLYELETEKHDFLMAEIEADKFVVDLGLSDELEQLLMNMEECSEKRMRLTYLTLKVFGVS